LPHPARALLASLSKWTVVDSNGAISAGQPANRVFILAGVVRLDILVCQRA
jgi:hypothetical protein